jgi:hypothetical protein
MIQPSVIKLLWYLCALTSVLILIVGIVGLRKASTIKTPWTLRNAWMRIIIGIIWLIVSCFKILLR